MVTPTSSNGRRPAASRSARTPASWSASTAVTPISGSPSATFADTVRRSITDPTVYANAARALLKALESRPQTRLIVIGGAGSLEIEPGVTRADSDELPHAALDQLGRPREYAAAVRGHRGALAVLRPGDQPVLDADGHGRISVEDAAVALIDEAELPRFVQRRFTIGR